MQRSNKLIQLFSTPLFLAGALTAGQALAGPGTVYFNATIKTTEFLLPAENCPAQLGGIGVGAGTTNLFTKKPATERTTAVLSSFDCVTPASGTSFVFGPGKFTLTGPGGDTILASYSGTLNLTGADPVTGLPIYAFDNNSMFTITGGTGRYSKATGSGTIKGTETINQATGTAQGALIADGSIIY